MIPSAEKLDANEEVTDSAITPSDINMTSCRALSQHATGNNEYDVIWGMDTKERIWLMNNNAVPSPIFVNNKQLTKLRASHAGGRLQWLYDAITFMLRVWKYICSHKRFYTYVRHVYLQPSI